VRRSVLILMLDVMVLSVLSMSLGGGDVRFPVPIHRWSELIERGLLKEAEYQERIAVLQATADHAAEARQQAELRAMLAEEQEKIIRLEAEQQRTVATRAERDAREAVLAARRAEADAAAEGGRREQLSEEAERAREREERAVAAAMEAERRAGEAGGRAEAVDERMQEALARIEEAAGREEEALGRAQQAELRARESETRIEMAERHIEEVREMIRDAVEMERAYAERVADAVSREAEIRGRADVMESELVKVQELASAAQSRIEDLRSNVSVLQVREDVALRDLAAAEEDRDLVEAEMLAREQALAEDRQQSVWVKRDAAMRRLSVFMQERVTRGVGERKEVELYLPLVRIGERIYLFTEFRTLEMDWWKIQYDRNLETVRYDIRSLESGETEPYRALSMLSLQAEPRVCLIVDPVADQEAALQAIGMQDLKEERIGQALLFDRYAPNRSIKVEITPALSAQYLIVKTAEPAARIRIRQGDYLLTENGRFIGVMVDSEHCFVVPSDFLDSEVSLQIPLVKPVGQNVHERFVDGARALRSRIRAISN